MNNKKSIFESLFEINVNECVEKKNGLSYLSWAYAWAEVKKKFPAATYKIYQFGENHLPYVFDEGIGYMVFTSVTIEGLTHSMLLPVMDSSNRTMKSRGYTYDTKFKNDISVEPATMFDVNKAIMRCLVKNLAMFGLGLYIYAGEDLPEIETERITQKDAVILKNMVNKMDSEGAIYSMILKRYEVKNFKKLSLKQYQDILSGLNEMARRNEERNASKI